MKVGDSAEVVRAYTSADVAAYAAITDAALPKDEAPEPLLGALFTYLLGVRLPGPGANYLKQNTRYIRNARIGETITARVTVTRLRPDKRLVDLETVCFGEDGELLCDGRALLLYPEAAT